MSGRARAAERERHGMRASVSSMSCIHNDDFSYLNAKKVKGEVSLFLEINFKKYEKYPN